MDSTVIANHSFRAYRAPKKHEAALIDPPLGRFNDLLKQRQTLDASTITFSGVSLHDLRLRAREQMIALAIEHTATYRNTPSFSTQSHSQGPIILSGHQPELFHPGVWFKNFLLSTAAKQTDAIAINFLVDQDVCRSPFLLVPSTGTDAQLFAANIPMDAPGASVPWEERGVVDEDVFASFADRIRSASGEWLDRPLITTLWPKVLQSYRRTGRIGLAITAARHSLEAELGLETLEVPLSKLCDTSSFATFLSHILIELPRIRPLYNEAVREYRQAHRIRSHSHPVPELDQKDDWFEAPFWVYTTGTPNRRSLYVRVARGDLELSDLGELRLNVSNISNQQTLSQRLHEELLKQSIKIRPRALMTTMYARLVLGDFFIHGIGGGKYDQLTDSMIRDVFAIEPPPYAVVSATVLLPDAPSLQAIELRTQELHQDLRRLKYQPERFPQANMAAPRLVASKNRLLRDRPSRGPKSQWHRCVHRLNDKLSGLLEPLRRRLSDDLLRSQQDLRKAKLLNSREWSFCLYRQDDLERSLKNLCGSPTDSTRDSHLCL